jgi:citrate lyase subunit beta/citryl-CoA lyase
MGAAATLPGMTDLRRPFRAMLYVPANVPRFVAKSATAGADAVVLDLEDSVPPAEKTTAREALGQAIATAGAGGATVLVRVNRPLELAVADVLAAAGGGAAGILLPKTLGPEHVQLMAELLARAEQRPMAILPLIETAAALQKVEAIATAHPRVQGLLIGTEDLATDLGAAPEDEILAFAKRRMALAAAAAGVFAYGTLGSVADYRDAEQVRRVAEAARRAGFAGATCIHPSLVPVLRAAFSPPAEEVAWAQRVLAAAAAAEAEGRGSFVVDGRMADEPIIARARRVLAAAGVVMQPSS